ncbi:uncharacterized protein BDR25DRAFT_90596 [Lindgomyces ingoldianus]|uniref:Uncharacterized protein n=1 Tax=Lindgomyces ingoldianus TaxID=673940 RepID=A0ACB6RCB6_9PLEO|nr:uncharacterized protein BDR25DRAFT_90596 [Lindgomyces ingoldianus]KAF2476106.1 hypothetical protein BDR25DRAFT_90596 [Lindgomyces ingoldianus]
MASTKLLDTHIHLWPSTSTSPIHHGWMTVGHPLAKRHGISDYNTVTHSTSLIHPSGFIYVETDRYLPSPTPGIISDVSGTANSEQKVRQWAHEPLQELKFLRRMVEGNPEEGDGFDSGDGEKMVGCVIWAPFHLPVPLFDLYLQIAEDISGPQLWKRVVGFRYLLQGIELEGEMRKLVESRDWLRNVLRLRSGREGKGWAFDIGVDSHHRGIWQMEVAADMVERVREMEGDGKDGRVRFVLNHLCKPDLSASPCHSRTNWLANITRFASQPLVYMKLSGVFNEFAPDPTPADVSSLLKHLEPEISATLTQFGPGRTMFGSDWPVCNIGGPRGEQSWGMWSDVVEKVLERERMNMWINTEGKESVWWRSGCEAYGVEI